MKKTGKKVFLICVFLFLAAVVFLSAYFYYPLRSYIIMAAYSAYNDMESVMHEQGFSVLIPGGTFSREKDWYPFVNIYNCGDGFSSYMDKNVDVTVLYNFGAFDTPVSSSIYNPDSDGFAAFYGAYVVKTNDENDIPYGFSADGEVNLKEIIALPEYDYRCLVLSAFGCRDVVFEGTAPKMVAAETYAGYPGWTVFQSDIKTSSPAHSYAGDRLPYIQYGIPPEPDAPDFYTIRMKGRMYVRYFPEYESTVVLYILGKSEKTIDACDQKILGATVIK